MGPVEIKKQTTQNNKSLLKTNNNHSISENLGSEQALKECSGFNMIAGFQHSS